jgi:hypothetical protein
LRCHPEQVPGRIFIKRTTHAWICPRGVYVGVIEDKLAARGVKRIERSRVRELPNPVPVPEQVPEEVFQERESPCL